ncbi:tricorn interacting aminopeptidase F1 [Labedella gwakjiensis]|uniref:Proline iminopeptidase n=1 Tax=Labedella gwakjiensis TaxID=390269 RepID=A0A2P8GUF4_9MICO|nr:proline iminopeptidase-family hydrolase [Labedella gwakjiensis]PSL37607.1 tricorn interacting aminopeptidase F1 [Labedella gwakjiensis]RUQ81700.1 alpha/beta fold hydrolase [Labedella gwakjiensis]
MQIIEGVSPYDGALTAYRVVAHDGDVLGSEGVTPLVVVHGGPGCTLDYLLSLTDLVRPGRPVVFYDQIGNGRSTHRPDAPASLWTVEFFLGELDALLDTLGIAGSYDLLGQSWGGMLGSEHAVRRPAGLRRLILANSPASMPRWRRAALELRAQLPEDVQRTLDAHEAAGTIDSAEYRSASDVFYARHVCRVVPQPPDVAATFAQLDADPTVYRAMNGPTEFHVVGSLREWSVEDRLHRIQVPTLVINGRYDEATDDTVAPFVDLIPDARHHRFEDSSHMPHWEERAAYVDVVARFLDA